MATFFNEFFGVPASRVDDYGAFNVSLINDLPLFIDPFLLFNSSKPEYQQLHDEILRYMVFLRDKITAGDINADLIKAWFMFPEVKQNWFGFSLHGNGGTGLGKDFADALRLNLARLFADFGRETITKSSHLEKVCLVQNGVGRDNISDFTTNLLKDYLCRYTEAFAVAHIDPSLRRQLPVNKALFNYVAENWERRTYDLPRANGDFVLLTPKDILTRDENWINRTDMIRDFERIPIAIPDAELRGQVFNYFHSILTSRSRRREAKQKDKDEAAARTIMNFPELIDYYIKFKENTGDEAADISSEKVNETQRQFETQVKELQGKLAEATAFYTTGKSTYNEAHRRLAYLKDVIENKGGHRIFYHDGVAIQRESDLQIIFRFVWFGSPSDVGTEANDGRGPVDYKIARGAKDKTLIEMKLAKNSALERNLEKQLPIYQAASDAEHGIKVIIFFSAEEQARVNAILKKLKLDGAQRCSAHRRAQRQQAVRV
jgi:Negative regulator of septation ring formation